MAPLGLVHQWKREILNRTKKGMFRVHVHHGSGQLKKRQDFMQYDVIITTYATLMQGYRNFYSFLLIKALHMKPKPLNGKRMTDGENEEWQDWLERHKGIIFKIEWFRIILDEAQYAILRYN